MLRMIVQNSATKVGILRLNGQKGGHLVYFSMKKPKADFPTTLSILSQTAIVAQYDHLCFIADRNV